MVKDLVLKFIGYFLEASPDPKLESIQHWFTNTYIGKIRDVIDSCKLEPQIDSAIGWVHYMYRKGFFDKQTHIELINYAIHKETKIMKEKIMRDFICPHLKKRADEIVEEERRKNIRLVKTENKQIL
jgi:hypothetical protein